MAFKSKLEWSNIGRQDMSAASIQALNAFIAAKAQLEAALTADAEAAGLFGTFAFSLTRGLPDSVGMAVTAGKAKATSGFGAMLKAPQSKPVSLAEFQESQLVSGRSA